MGVDAMILVFWILNFKPDFSLSSFTLIKRLFSSSLLSALRVVSSAYLRLLIFIAEIFIPAWASSSILHDVLCINKQGDNIQFLSYHFPSFEPVCSWPVYRFFKRLVTWSGILASFPQIVVIHTIKGFSVVSEAEVDVFLELSCFFYDPTDVGNLISGSAAFSKSSLNIWNSWVTYCWSLTWRILSITLLACKINAIVW